MAHPASDASTVVVNPTATETSTNPVWRFVTNPWFLVFVALAIGVTLGILFTPSLLPYVFLLAETPFFAALGGMSSLYAAGAVIAVTAGATMAVAGGVLKAFVEAADWALGRIFGGQAKPDARGDGAKLTGEGETTPMLGAADTATLTAQGSDRPYDSGPAGASYGNPFAAQPPAASGDDLGSHATVSSALRSDAEAHTPSPGAAQPLPAASSSGKPATHAKVPSFGGTVASFLRFGRGPESRTTATTQQHSEGRAPAAVAPR